MYRLGGGAPAVQSTTKCIVTVAVCDAARRPCVVFTQPHAAIACNRVIDTPAVS